LLQPSTTDLRVGSPAAILSEPATSPAESAQERRLTMLSTDNLIRLTPEAGHAPFTAIPRATAMVKRLVREHGPVAIYQSGGCCDGSLPLCLLADELGQGPNDLLLGEVEGVPFYIDAEQYQRWGEPEFLLDVASGAPEGFSLGLPDAHFVTLSLSGEACQLRAV
jgi:uncharacterized protein (DUF779 family)